MRKKIFTFLLALAASVGMMNAKVTWNSSNISNFNVYVGYSYSKEGVTLSSNAEMVDAYWHSSQTGLYFNTYATGGFTFSNTLGKNFTKIEMFPYDFPGWDGGNLGSGWLFSGGYGDPVIVTWTGNAATVDLLKDESHFNGEYVKSIVFYFEGDSQEPDPTYTVALKAGTANANKVTLSATSAIEGATITVTPDEEYEITAFKAKYNTTEEAASTLDPGTGAYSFTMPAYDVTIEATIALKPVPEGDVFAGFTATAGSGGFNNEGHANLVDNKFTSADWTKWCADNSYKSVPTGESGDACWWIDFEASAALDLTGYILTTGNDTGNEHGRNPKNWVLKAKLNAGDAWTTIATVTNDVTMKNQSFKDYKFFVDQPGTYQYFRFEVFANQGAGVMQLCELRLIGTEPVLVTTHTLQLHVNDALMGSVALQNPSNDIVDNGDGTYTVPEGATVTLIATPNEGYEFSGWKASNSICEFTECEFVALSTVDNPLTVDMYMTAAFMAEFAAVAPQPQPVAVDDKLSGAFSVDDGKVVYFSKGNLQATTNDQGATWTWAFAANQYDYIGKAAANNAINGNGTVSTNGTVDLFGWSTSSTVYGIHYSNNTYTYDGDFVDWSSNTDLIASLGEDWRTLTSSEWGYLLNWRTTTSGVRYAKATVNGVAGLIILPDNWDVAYHALASTNDPDVDFDDNIINAEWTNELEAHGAVFLPAAGNRQGTNVSEAGSAGYYWSAISVDGNTADYMYFNDYELSANSFNSRHNGWSVRLVSDIPPIPTSGSCGDNLTWEFNTETGALTISGTGAMTSAPWGTYKEDITSLSLPDGLTAIPSEAFKGCTGLTTVTIPASVTSIGADAFHGCTSVTDVYCYPKAADLDWNDYYTDDFIEYPAIETRCHVYADECSEYIARYSQGDGVNVTFMNDLEAVAVTTNEDPQNPAVYYSTFYHGTKKYRLPNDGTEAYVADLSGSDLRLTKIAEGNDVLPNGVAVILKAPGINVTLFPTEAEPVTFTAHNSLQGVDAETTAPENTYVLSGTEQHGVGFYLINSATLKAHKAYVVYYGSQTNAPARMRFVFNEEKVATSVDQVPSDQVQSTKELRDGQLVIIKNGVKYNAQGQIVK
ncbi:MAG: leucine-rich repeat protein [Paludibacteraceae bacterium]|nr:leucine-rich repeat protein [Paludibacteraceae bacterium]